MKRHVSIGFACILVGWMAPVAVAQPPKALMESGSKIAFLGDSITDQGWKHPAGYVRLVVHGLETNKIRVTPIPAGVGGNIAREMRERLQKDVLDKNPELAGPELRRQRCVASGPAQGRAGCLQEEHHGPRRSGPSGESESCDPDDNGHRRELGRRRTTSRS